MWIYHQNCQNLGWFCFMSQRARVVKTQLQLSVSFFGNVLFWFNLVVIVMSSNLVTQWESEKKNNKKKTVLYIGLSAQVWKRHSATELKFRIYIKAINLSFSHHQLRPLGIKENMYLVTSHSEKSGYVTIWGPLVTSHTKEPAYITFWGD